MQCRCGHCKALAPPYEEAATALKEKNIKLAKVNCVDEAEFCQNNGIQGYPYVLVSPRLLCGVLITSLLLAVPSVCIAMASTATTLALGKLMASSATW